MRNISAWAIKHPIFPVVLFMVLTFVGLASFIKLPIQLNPDISFPMVTVMVSQPGAAPTEMETQILQKVEGAVANIGNVRNITSRATEGSAMLFISFEIGTPIDRAVSDVRDAVARVRGDLPEGIQEPVVQRIDAEGNAIAYYAVSATSMTEEQLSWFVDHTVSKRLLTLKGVAQVSRGGGVSREVRVDLDPSRLQALGITAAQVNQQLRSLNIDAAGGRAQISGGEQSIRVLGGARTSADLGSTQIQVGGGRTARLDEIAHVYDGVGEIRTISRLNGRPATTFGVYRSRGNSDVDVFKRISKEVDSMLQDNPGVSAKIVFTTVENTQSSYDSAIEALIEGSLLAVLVVWRCFRESRSTALSALALDRASEGFAPQIQRACDALAALQGADGAFGGEGRARLYNHAITTFALATLCPHHPALKPTLDRALAFVSVRQTPQGGWDYEPGSEGNAAVTAWQVRALACAEAQGFDAAKIPLRKGLRWLRSVARDDGSIAYHRDSTACSDGLTALAAYTLITAGKDFPGLQELGRHAAEALSAAPEKSAVADCYRDYAKVLAFDSVGANAQAETVRKQMHVQQQAAQPDQWAKVGGRLYTTALTALAAR